MYAVYKIKTDLYFLLTWAEVTCTPTDFSKRINYEREFLGLYNLG